ncbi:hypothetical protein BRADI_1g54656v3 [Brachypodium distachyon]|uniref:Uncharacterized protein n=1 Tax=Brachypodium distachyon TaxID=15368 RepID=A0A0Q3NSK8_BRADI|nr:hypothetical protein BRADI_1g54656v3 [Brachypodium distachyon]
MRTAKPASTATLVMLFGGLVLVSLMVEASAKPSSPVSAADAVVGGRRMMTGVNGGLSQKTPEELKADDPLSSSKRRVPNGPDPVHNRGAGESGRSPGRA